MGLGQRYPSSSTEAAGSTDRPLENAAAQLAASIWDISAEPSQLQTWGRPRPLTWPHHSPFLSLCPVLLPHRPVGLPTERPTSQLSFLGPRPKTTSNHQVLNGSRYPFKNTCVFPCSYFQKLFEERPWGFCVTPVLPSLGVCHSCLINMAWPAPSALEGPGWMFEGRSRLWDAVQVRRGRPSSQTNHET